MKTKQKTLAPDPTARFVTECCLSVTEKRINFQRIIIGSDRRPDLQFFACASGLALGWFSVRLTVTLGLGVGLGMGIANPNLSILGLVKFRSLI